MTDQPSEYGGVPGLMPPAPHVPTAAEEATMLRRADLRAGQDAGAPADPADATRA